MIVWDFNYNDLLAYTWDEWNEDNNDNFCQFDVSSFNLCISKL
jgi:hypothetical protein